MLPSPAMESMARLLPWDANFMSVTRTSQKPSFGMDLDYGDSQGGFTLLELLLATFIASLVMGMLSVALTFSLGMWEREQNRQHDSAESMVDLLKFQLAGLDTSPLPLGEQPEPLFLMKEDSIVFVTAHSVKAISGGAPAVVRYLFDAAENRLFYGEIPFSPHRLKMIEEFLETTPSGQREARLFFSVDMEEFSLLAEQEEQEDFSTELTEETIPQAVIVNWQREGEAHVRTVVLRTNYLFPPVAVAPRTGTTPRSPF